MHCSTSNTSLRQKASRLAFAGLLLTLACESGAGESARGFKGEYILSRDEYHQPVCKAFTRNLNEFRRLNFTECNPRLSSQYPEFSRPKWEEIPFDLAVAEKVVKESFGTNISPRDARLAEEQWQRWLKGTEQLRQAGKARIWRTRIDLGGTGTEQTIIRMTPDIGGADLHSPDRPLQLAPDEGPWNCEYNKGTLHMLDGAPPIVRNSFNTSDFEGMDLVGFGETPHYFRVLWNPFGPAYQRNIGATAGVVLSAYHWHGDGQALAGGNMCLIDWVPTGKYRPLKQKATD